MAVSPFPCERGWFISRRSYRGEVKLMWKRQVFVLLRYLVFAALAMRFLTIKAC